MSQTLLVYGLHAVSHLLQESPKRALSLSVLDGKKSDRKEAVIALAKKHQLPVKHMNQNEFMALLPDEHAVHQGVMLTCRALPGYREADLLSLIQEKRSQNKSICLLVLDGVQDPRNLGACLRSAAAFSVDAVILPKDRSASLTASAEKVACGGAAMVPLVTVTNLARTLKQLQEERLWIVGLTGDTEQELSSVDLTGDIILVMGNEETGMRNLTEKHCDFLARIPISGGISSLNVSAAATVALYELVRQRSK